MNPRRTRRLLIAALAVADIILAILVTGRFFFRIDLSRNRVYTLSATSKAIVAGLPGPATITYYVSEKLGSRYPFPAQIEDLLNEYSAWSGGKVSVAVVDPARSNSSSTAEALGVLPRQMQVVERQEMNLATVYSGIVIQYLDKSETLPFVSDLTTLEYDLSSKIRSLTSGSARTVGVLIGDSRRQFDRDFTYLGQELGTQFKVREVEKDKEIPAEISVLFLIGNRDMDDFATLPVDQFLMRGGKVLFAVDSVDVDISAGLNATVNKEKAVLNALAAYGVTVKEELVLDTLNQRISFRLQGGRYMVANYPLWITISDKYVDHDNPITARFAGLDLYWPCPLSVVQQQGVKAQVIASTSPRAWTMKDNFDTNPALLQALQSQAEAELGQRPVVVALSGTFLSAFAGKPAPTRPGETAGSAAGGQAAAKSPLREKSPETRILVVGDADFPSDMIQYTQADYNMAFLSNSAEWLSQEDDLLAIKTRAQVDTRLTRITDPAAKASAMLVSQAVNVALIPFLVVAAGVARLLVRRRRKQGTLREAK